MATQYRVYGNTGVGDAVDYTTVLHTTASQSWSPPALAPGSDWTFAVRAFDTVTGYEEANVDARVRIHLNAAGADLSLRPAPPLGLRVDAVSGGVRVAWGCLRSATPAPTGFKVWVTSGASVNYAAAPAATVAFDPDQATYVTTVTGLTPGGTYSVGVRATNAAGDEPNTNAATVTVPSAGPAAVTDLTGGLAP